MNKPTTRKPRSRENPNELPEPGPQPHTGTHPVTVGVIVLVVLVCVMGLAFLLEGAGGFRLFVPLLVIGALVTAAYTLCRGTNRSSQ